MWKKIIVWMMVLSIFLSSSGLEVLASNVASEDGGQIVHDVTEETDTEPQDESDQENDMENQQQGDDSGEEGENPGEQQGQDGNQPEEENKQEENSGDGADENVEKPEDSTPEGSEEQESESEIEDPEKGETEGDNEEELEEVIEEESVSENDVHDQEIGQLDYILGRPMTEEEIEFQKSLVPDLVPMKPIELDTDDLFAGMGAGMYASTRPSYDSRNLGIITPIRDQNPFGTCWAFSTFAIMESSLVNQNLATKDGIDLSERHLAYFTRNNGYDALDNSNEDNITPMYPTQYLEGGGSLTDATLRLMNWQGAAEESKYPYSNDEIPEDITRENAQDIVAIAKDIYFLPTQDANVAEEVLAVKNMILQYGAVSWSYYHHNNYYNYSTGGYYMNVDAGTNHAITIVGWDDNYSKDNFLSTNQKPANDGAWIVKNSWGEWFGNNGYFYISYEDATLGQGNDAGVMIAADASEYDNNYFYGNTTALWLYSCEEIAQVFETKGNAEQEILSAVSFMLASASESYEIQIYKNPQTVNGVVVDPESGEKMYATPIQGETGYAGLYTVDIPKVILQKGDIFSVVVSFTDEDGATVYTDGDHDGYYSGEKLREANDNKTEAGQSFRQNYGRWQDLHGVGCSVRLNALTINAGGSVPALQFKTISPNNFEDTQKNRLSWTQCTNVNKYEVLRSESQAGDYSKIGEVSSGTSVYVDELTYESWNKTYYYKIRSVFLDDATTESEAIEIPGNITLKITDVTIENTANNNIITWESIVGASGYEIERKLNSEENFIKIATITDGTSTSYNDLNVGDVAYVYRVRAYKSNVYSLWSDPVTVDKVKVKIYTTGNTQYLKVTWELLEEASFYQVIFWRRKGDYRNGYYWTTSSNSLSVTTQKLADLFNASGYGGYGEELIIEVVPMDANGAEIIQNPFQEVKKILTPMEVTSVSNTYNKGTATYTWQGAVNAEFIDIYKSTDANSHGNEVWKTVKIGEVTNFKDSDLERGEIVYYWLYSGVTNLEGNKVYSDVFQYKMVVPTNTEDIEFEIEDTILTKGGETTFTLSEIDSGKSYEYTGAVNWSAKSGKTNYQVVTENGITKVLGSDEQEILRINNRTITATGLSVDKAVTLIAGVGGFKKEISITIQVPLTEVTIKPLSVNGETVTELPEELYLNDVVVLRAEYLPENADVKELQWNCDDTSRISLLDHKDGTATATIIKAGKASVRTTVIGNGKNVEGTIALSAILKTIEIREIKALDAKHLQISWDAVYENELYHVYRKAEGETEYSIIAQNVSQTTYTDDTVETGVNYSYKIQNEKDGIPSSLDTTKAKEGKTIPDPILVLKKTYHSLVIKNDTSCEYAISTENNPEELTYDSYDGKEEIVFTNLEELQTYYVFARLKKYPHVYADILQVTLPEKGILTLSKDKISLSKGQSYEINYVVSTGDGLNEDLTWTALDLEEETKVLATEYTDDEILVIKGEDQKEIARLVGNQLIATGLSQTKAFRLTGKNSYDLEGSCEVLISVPVTDFALEGMKINGTDTNDISLLNLQDVLELEIAIEPENADESTISWKTSNEHVVQIVTTSAGGKKVTLKAEGKGNCRITATTDKGLEKSWKIQVYDANEVLEYWLVGNDDVLELSQVVGGLTEDKNYIVNDFIPRSCELSIEEGNAEEEQLKIFGLKRRNGELPEYPTSPEDLYQLEVISFDKVSCVSANPAIAKVTAEGKVIAVNQGETDIYVYGTSTKENFGSYHVVVTGNALESEELCPIESSVRLLPVESKVWLEQFRHHSRDSVTLEIKDKEGTAYPAESFTFTSEDSQVCMVDENGIVRANPSYVATKDKTVKITAAVKNDPKKRKVTFYVSLYGKQQIAELDILYENESPDVVTKKFARNDSFVVSAIAWGSNGEEIENPSIKWSASNSSVATVRTNRDESATVIMKKAGQGNVVCTANDYKKTKDIVLVRAIDVAPVVTKTALKVETKKLSKMIEGKKYKNSPNFNITGGYGITYHEPTITSAKAGKTNLDITKMMLVKNRDNSYCIGLEEAYARQFSNNTKIVVNLTSEIIDVPMEVDFTEVEFPITLQIVTKEPSVSLSEAGTINRYYSGGEKAKSLLTVKATPNVTKVEVTANGQINNFNQYFTAVQEQGQWYLVLKNAENYTKDSLQGKLLVTLEGYETIEKIITVRTSGKKPVVTQQEIPMIFVKGEHANKKADVVLLNHQEPMNSMTLAIANGSLVVGENQKVTQVISKDGKIQITLNESSNLYVDNEVVSIPVNIWETDSNGENIWYTPQTLEVKVQVSTKEPTLQVKNKTVVLNNQMIGEEAETKLYTSHQNLNLKAADQWKVMEYNNVSKEYDKTVDWLAFSYDDTDQMLGIKLTKNQKAGSYKIRVTNTLEGFESVAFAMTIKVVSKEPSVTIKSSGKLDLTNKEGCSIVGKVSFKNTISNRLIQVEIIEDERFGVTLTGENTFAVHVKEQGLVEDSIPLAKIILKVKITLEGGNILVGEMQIRPIRTTPKMMAIEAKEIQKCFQEQGVRFDLSHYLVKGAKIKKVEVIKAPEQFSVTVNEEIVQVNLKDKGMKARNYVIKLKVTFGGLVQKPQYISLPVNVLE